MAKNISYRAYYHKDAHLEKPAIDYPKTIERLKILRAEEKHIGCGYCKLEIGCSLKIKGKNMAREGCLHFDKVEFKINKNGIK